MLNFHGSIVNHEDEVNISLFLDNTYAIEAEAMATERCDRCGEPLYDLYVIRGTHRVRVGRFGQAGCACDGNKTKPMDSYIGQ